MYSLDFVKQMKIFCCLVKLSIIF